MKEDILEQVVEDYLHLKGYFTLHNLKFKPDDTHPDFEKRQDSVPSDIDILGFHPGLSGPEKVFAVSCKSWQRGFNPEWWVKVLGEKGRKVNGRDAWRSVRELTMDKWAKAFVKTVRGVSKAEHFTYCTAVTKVIGPKEPWESNQSFIKKLGGNPIKVLTVDEMLTEIWPKIGTTLASSELGRLLQIVKASGWKVPEPPGRKTKISPGG